VKSALLSSVDMLDAGSDTDDIASLITKSVAAGKPKDKIHIYEKDVESRYREDARNPIPFPWDTLTKYTQGGMGGGDLIVPVSGPKGGKSWVCIASAGNAAILGKSVMYYSLELSEDYVGKRFDAFFTKIPVHQLTGNTQMITEKIQEIKGRIRIKKYPPGKTTLSHIENHLRRMRTQEDFVPDFIIIDYLEKLGNPKNRKDRNEDASDIFTEAKGLAEILNVPLMSPAQANRTAEGLDVIKGQHLAGTYEKFMIADIIFTVAKKTNIWYIMGNRYGEDDICFKSTFDRKTGHILIDSEPYDPDEQLDMNKPDTKERMTKRFKKLDLLD
jgi:replicative DNA helicase